MVEKDESTEETTEEHKSSARTRRGVEERLDEMTDKFTSAMSDGVKRMEGVFQEGIQDLKNNPDIPQQKIRSFFMSSSGGAALVLIGILWFFYAVGLLNNAILPLILIVVGIYMMRRFRGNPDE